LRLTKDSEVKKQKLEDGTKANSRQQLVCAIAWRV